MSIVDRCSCRRCGWRYTTTQKSAFNELMTSSKKRSFPNLKSDEDGNRFTRKDELHNEVAKIFRERKIDLHDSKVSTDGDCVSVITSALWSITNDHNTINNACRHTQGIIPIPMAFKHCDGYNNVKRKKKSPSVGQKLLAFTLQPCTSAIYVNQTMEILIKWCETARRLLVVLRGVSYKEVYIFFFH